MLFHITARHDHVTCPRRDPARSPVRKFVEASSVKIVGAWVDAPSHTIYALVESDSAEAIRDACEGLMDIGPVEVRLVREVKP
jgi:hypothetical protein